MNPVAFMVDDLPDLTGQTDQVAGLHKRLVEGDPVASELLAAVLLCQLQKRLRHLFPAADTQLLADAVSDALLHYFRRPFSFNPAKCPKLESYLLMAATRNLLNTFKSESSRKCRETDWANGLQQNSVADYPSSRNKIVNDGRVFDILVAELSQTMSGPLDR